MFLALFQRHETHHEKQNHGANADKNYNGDHAGRPFEYRSSFHSFATDEHRSNTDYKPACSRLPRGSATTSVKGVAHRTTATVIGGQKFQCSRTNFLISFTTRSSSSMRSD